MTSLVQEAVFIPVRLSLVTFSFFYGLFWYAVFTIPLFLINLARGRFKIGIKLTPEQTKTAIQNLENYPVKHNFLKSTDGVKIHYSTRHHRNNVKGTLIFVHGYPSTWYSWKDQLDYFYEKGYNVIAPDLRGYGDSDKPSLPFSYSMMQLVKDLDLIVKKGTSGGIKPVIVAHDWGGLISSSYAAKFGSKIEKLILINTTHYGAMLKGLITSPKQLLKSFYVFMFQFPIMAELFCCQEKAFRGAGAPKKLSEEDRLSLMYKFRNPRLIMGGVNIYRAHVLWGLAFWKIDTLKEYIFKTVGVKTVMIWGKYDKFLGLNVPVENKNWFDDYEIDYLDDPKAGHWLITDNAVEVNKKIKKILEK